MLNGLGATVDAEILAPVTGSWLIHEKYPIINPCPTRFSCIGPTIRW